MSMLVASGLSTPGANTKTADLISGDLQFVKPGTVTLVAKGSAAGINATITVGGVALANDLPVIFTGTAGTISVKDNIVAAQKMAGGKVSLYLRNTTATAGTTCDYAVYWDP